MYGTIARFSLKPGMAEEFGKVAAAQDNVSIPGYIGSVVYHSDTNPDECWLVVTFQDRESYVKNADSPEQNARYQELVPFFAKDPEWHDGEIVYTDTAKSTA
ncbi:MAG: antibiotic biosynthesis monooxygenase [Dehalococcoidia bacterium]